MLPKGIDPAVLREPIATFREQMRAAGKPNPEVTLLTELALDDRGALTAWIQSCADAGVTRVSHSWRYADADEFARVAELLAAARA